MKNKVYGLASLFLFTAIGASAAPASNYYTIKTAVEQALERNPDVRSAREAQRASEFNQSLAVTKILPSVVGTVEGERIKASPYGTSTALFGGNAYNLYIAKLTGTQPIYDGVVYAGFGYAKKDIEIKRFQAEVAERNLSLSVIQAFYSVLLDQHLLKILKDTSELDKETLKVAERYYRIGRAQKLDVLQLQTQVALLDPQIAQADDQMETAASQLATLLRGLDEKHIQIHGNLVSPDDVWVKQAEKNRLAELPEVLAAHMQVEQFKDTRDITMAQYWPTLNLTGSIGRQAYTKNDLINGNTTSWDVALILSIPIFNGFGSISQDKNLAAQGHEIELAEMKTADTVAESQITAEKDLQVAQTTMAAAREAEKYGKESLKEAKYQYRLQTINYIQYQSSVQAFLSSESGYFQAKYNYIVAVAKYFNAIGVPIRDFVDYLDKLGQTIQD